MNTSAERYRILGSIEVRTGESWVDVPPAKWRALLAVLLINANHIVPVDELEHQLWPQCPPPAARKLVQHYVSRVRRLIGDPRGHALRTRPRGYELTVGRGELDADRFMELSATGHRALVAGEHVAAARHFLEALSCWRGGAALANVGGVPAVEIERFRLNEHRLTTVETWLRAELAGGTPEAVIAELQALVAAHPLRERMRELLMIALYLAGRRCDALAACRDLRAILREEHGLDPDDSVCRLEQKILRGEPVDLMVRGRLPSPPVPAARPQ
ncbi:AfsR/SARP family transcriptional regulator [Dactylosporangium sp. CA-233914]|uniref:AfsR/SARP family transcriptional regulator n=1 Tax=Dactylosporangium sp. CA-233914 TaxID=3239934 RepID=UPI003D8F2EAA